MMRQQDIDNELSLSCIAQDLEDAAGVCKPQPAGHSPHPRISSEKVMLSLYAISQDEDNPEFGELMREIGMLLHRYDDYTSLLEWNDRQMRTQRNVAVGALLLVAAVAVWFAVKVNFP